MSFWDKFRRKKAVLIQEASLKPQQELPVQKQSGAVLPDQQITSPRIIRSRPISKSSLPRTKRKKKRKVMRTKSPPKHRKAARRTPSSQSIREEEGNGKKWLQKDRALLGGALRDLNRELQGLRSARKRLELKMANFSTQLGDTQDKEIGLRNKISELMKKEAALTKKKATTKDKLGNVDQKIEKVRTIQAELKNI